VALARWINSALVPGTNAKLIHLASPRHAYQNASAAIA
jgi:hypothetical protein